MKKVLAAPVILALLTAGSYGVFGYMAKNNFDDAMAQISSQIPTHIDITYNQGFLSSTVDLNVKVPMIDADVDLEITSSHTIYHGPFIFHTMQGDHPAYIPVQAYTEGNLSYILTGVIDSKITQTITEATTTRINSYLSLMGNATVQFSGDPVNKELNIEGTTLAIDWQGFNGSLDMQGSMEDFTYDFSAPGLTLSGDGPEKFTMTQMSSSGAGHAGSFDIGLGDYRAGIQNVGITLSEEPGDEIILDDLQVNIIADEKDGLLTFSQIFDINTFSFDNKTYGPANTTIHLRNLDAKTLSEMNHEYTEMQKINGNDPEALQAQLLQMATSHGVTLLSKSPGLDFENISLKTAEGAGELRLKINFNGDGEVVLNPFFLLGRLSAEASFGADEQFVAVLAKDLIKESMCEDDNDTACDQQAARASSEQLQSLMSDNKLLLENGRYVATINYKDGAAILNGTPLPIF